MGQLSHPDTKTTLTFVKLWSFPRWPLSETAVVAIGAGVDSNGKMSKQSKIVCDEAFRICSSPLSAILTDVIICLGRPASGARSKNDAQMVQDYLLRKKGIAWTTIWKSNHKNTRSNFANVLKIAFDRKIKGLAVIVRESRVNFVEETLQQLFKDYEYYRNEDGEFVNIQIAIIPV